MLFVLKKLVLNWLSRFVAVYFLFAGALFSSHHIAVADTTAGEVLVFVSASMGDRALQEYFAEAERRGNCRLIMRGLHDNSFLRTKALADRLKIRWDIDPTLFEAYGVEVVPTIVLLGKKRAGLLRGANTIKAALEKFATEAERCAD